MKKKSKQNLGKITHFLLFLHASFFITTQPLAYNPTLGQNANLHYPKTFKDKFNNTITLVSEPSRIVSLAPNITEILYFIGKGDKLVGVTNYCDFPKEALKIKKIGGILDPNLEKIVSLKPDLVIGIAQGRIKPLIEKFKEIKINIHIVSIKKLEDIINVINKLAEITGVPLEKVNNYKELYARFENLKKISSLVNPLRTLLIVNAKPLFISTDKSIEGQIIEKLGGVVPKSIAGENYIVLGKEGILKFMPQLIIVARKNDNKTLEYSLKNLSIPAAKQNLILSIDEDIIVRPGPRIFDGIEEIKRDMLKANEFYSEKRKLH